MGGIETTDEEAKCDLLFGFMDQSLELSAEVEHLWRMPRDDPNMTYEWLQEALERDITRQSETYPKP